MNDDKSIHIKLELTKNPQEKTLTLTVHLNPNAPNIITHEDHISWTFTREEQDFLYDAITILRNKKPFPTPAPHKTTPTTYPPQTTDDAINEGFSRMVRECSAVKCPLYDFRPYQAKEPVGH